MNKSSIKGYNMRKSVSILLIAVILISCSPHLKYFHFEYNHEKCHQIKSVVVTPIDMVWDKPKGATDQCIAKVETTIEEYLKDNGFSVLSNKILEKHWEEESQKAGGFFDPRTGKVNGSKVSKHLMNTIKIAGEIQNFDAIIFLRIMKRPAKLVGDRVYWDGSSRKIYDDNGDVITDVTWQGEIGALSLSIQIFNRNQKLLFRSVGALEFPYEFSKTYTKKEFVWKQQFNFNTDEVMEGISVALHPFIAYKNYPKNPQFYQE